MGEGFTTSRRDLITKGAVAGAAAWAAPQMLSMTAAAAQSNPNPPCTYSRIWTFDNGNGLTVPPAGYLPFTNGAAITGTGWNAVTGTGTGVDVVGPSFGTRPPWVTSNWVDLISGGSSGGMTTSFTVPCTGCYELRFHYSKYDSPATNPSMSIDVNGNVTAVGPISSTSMATFAKTYTFAAATSVTLRITSTGSGNIGMAGDDFSFTYLGVTCP